MDRSDRSDLPVRPIGPCRTGHNATTGQTGWCQFCLSTYAPLFFGKACLSKNILLSQNYLRAMINTTSAIFVRKATNNHRPCFAQVDVETTCLGRHTFFIIADVVAFASEYETSLRDTTSAVNTLNLAPYSSHSLCCNQHLA